MGFIYRLYNKVSNKSYIGQTSRTVQARWYDHVYREKNFQTKLARAIRKYKITDWDVQTLETCNNDLLNQRERYWIKYYDSFNNGYNCTLGGEGCIRLDYESITEQASNNIDIYTISKLHNTSPQTIKYILNANNISYETKPFREPIPIEMIDIITLQTVATFPSITAAAQYQKGWSTSTICAALNNRRHSAYGYYWKKVGENKQFNHNVIPHKHKIIQYDTQGNKLQQFESIAAANRALGKPSNHHSIGNCLAGHTKTALGFIWRSSSQSEEEKEITDADSKNL